MKKFKKGSFWAVAGCRLWWLWWQKLLTAGHISCRQLTVHFFKSLDGMPNKTCLVSVLQLKSDCEVKGNITLSVECLAVHVQVGLDIFALPTAQTEWRVILCWSLPCNFRVNVPRNLFDSVAWEKENRWDRIEEDMFQMLLGPGIDPTTSMLRIIVSVHGAPPLPTGLNGHPKHVLLCWVTSLQGRFSNWNTGSRQRCIPTIRIKEDNWFWFTKSLWVFKSSECNAVIDGRWYNYIYQFSGP